MADSKSTKPVAAKVAKPARKVLPVYKATAPAAGESVAPKTISAPAIIAAAEPAAVTPIATPEITPTPVAPVTAIQKDVTMNDTVTKFAEEAKTRTETVVAEFQTRAKAAVEKGQAGLADAVEFNKGNVEAVVASAKVAAKGVQDIASYSVEYGKGAIEKAVTDTRRLYAVKSPTEFFSLQSEIAKANVDEAVAQVSKFTESYLKLVGEVFQPLSNRYALAAEKVKTAVAA